MVKQERYIKKLKWVESPPPKTAPQLQSSWSALGVMDRMYTVTIRNFWAPSEKWEYAAKSTATGLPGFEHIGVRKTLDDAKHVCQILYNQTVRNIYNNHTQWGESEDTDVPLEEKENGRITSEHSNMA